LICPKCKTENPQKAIFCRNCGSRLPITYKMGEKPERKKSIIFNTLGSSWGKVLALIIICAVVLVGGIGIYSHYQEKPIEPQSSVVAIESHFSGEVEYKDPRLNTVQKISIDKYFGHGSGFIVSKDGYVITAAHVVCDPMTLINENKFRKMEDEDIETYVNMLAYAQIMSQDVQFVNSAIDMSDDEYFSYMYNLTKSAMASGTLQATKYSHKFYLRGPTFQESVNNPPVATLISISRASENGSDLALMKIDNVKGNLPVLKISNEKIKVGESVSVYGYPIDQFIAYEYDKDEFDPEEIFGKKAKHDAWQNVFAPSKTTGIVSGVRATSKDIQYYQTDAAVDSGSSGGPVCNAKDQVIGIVIMGGSEMQGFNFFLSSEYIIDMCKENGVSLEEDKPLFFF